MQFRAATRDEVIGLAADTAQEVTPAAARRHRTLLDDGEEFFVGVADGRIVYHAWAVRRRWRIAGVHHLAPGKGKATILGCFTLESHRGRGIYPAALRAHLGRLKAQGVSRVFINVEQDNLASRRGIEKAGFRPVGIYQVARLLGRTRLIMEPALRRAVESDWPD